LTYQVLARKWRPQEFDAVVGQDPVTRTLRNALSSGRVAHAYLFTGPRGVGKTTTARLLAKALACTARTGPEACGACPSCQDFVSGAPVDVMEIDAASNTSVDDIRTLRENVKYAPARGRFKVYIVDEVHMLSGAAFNAFLKTLEEPPPHVVFILATTDPKKIPATVLSRCQRFDFRPISPEQLTETLSRILTEEGVPFEPAALPVLVRAAEGSLRDALSLLDTAIAYGEGKLDETSVARLLGSSSPVHVRGFVTALLARDGAAALEAIDRAATAGEDLGTLCREAIEMARRHSQSLAVLYLDVDRFKHINDTLGHAVGDRLLQSIARRLVACVRSSDTVSRLGGDEFVVLLSEVACAEDALRAADKIRAAMAAPQRIDQLDLHVTVSLGIGLYPDDGTDAETLLKNADLALLRAKADGRGNSQLFEPDIDVHAAREEGRGYGASSSDRAANPTGRRDAGA